MKCECDNTFKYVKKAVADEQSVLQRAWEDGGFYAREVMHELTIRIQKYLKEHYISRCGCILGSKLSRIKTLVDPYEQNLEDAQAQGGEYFTRMTKQGAYTEILQILDE